MYIHIHMYEYRNTESIHSLFPTLSKTHKNIYTSNMRFNDFDHI